MKKLRVSKIEGFEDYTEQPMLSATIAEETVAPPIRTESRGKRKAASE